MAFKTTSQAAQLSSALNRGKATEQPPVFNRVDDVDLFRYKQKACEQTTKNRKAL
jgi:hypothetical protein